MGSYPSGASPYGALDMSGNVAEWVYDWYDSTYYNASPYRNPQGPESGTYRVTRGGNWYNDWKQVRTHARFSYTPTYTPLAVGIRCAYPP